MQSTYGMPTSTFTRDTNSPVQNWSPSKISMSSRSFNFNFMSSRATTRTDNRGLSPTQIMLERYELKRAASATASDAGEIVVRKVKGQEDQLRLIRTGSEAEEYRRHWVQKVVNGEKNVIETLFIEANREIISYQEQRRLIVGIMIQLRHYGGFKKETLFRGV